MTDKSEKKPDGYINIPPLLKYHNQASGFTKKGL